MFLRTFTLTAVLLTLGIYATELFIYEGFFERLTGISTEYIYVPSIIVLFFYRFVFRNKFPEKLKQILLFLIPIVVSTCVGIQIIHPLVHANFFFSTFHIHPPQLEPIALYLTGVSFFIFDKDFFTNNKKLFLFVFPFWFLSLSVYFKWNFPHEFWYAEKEDSITEYFTFIVYLVISFISYKSVKLFLSNNKIKSVWKKFFVIIFVLISFLSFVIAGEEISWAQRIIGFETPDTIAENNTQNEFNLHNQESIFQYVYTAYAIVGLYGVTAWMISKLISKFKISNKFTHLLEFFSPSWRLIGFFIPIIVYAYLRHRFGDAMFDQWEELMELYLAVGLMIFIFDKYNEIKKGKSPIFKFIS